MDAAARINEVAQGYQGAIVLLTACKMGVFAALGKESVLAQGVANRLGLDVRAIERLLFALVADGFLESDEAGFRINEEYAPFLLPSSERTRASILNHNHACMQNWARLDEVLRTGEPVAGPTKDKSPEALRDFICGMANISRGSSREVAEQVDMTDYNRMLDLGGGPGTASIAFAQSNPVLRSVVYDLEPVTAIAREEIEKAGLSDRIETCAGDFLLDDLPSGQGEGFDMVYISNIIHMLSPAEMALILKKSARSLRPGGVVMIKDFFLEDDRASPRWGAFFSVNMLVNTRAGKSYTLTETLELLHDAGFGDHTIVEVAMNSRLVVATLQG